MTIGVSGGNDFGLPLKDRLKILQLPALNQATHDRNAALVAVCSGFGGNELRSDVGAASFIKEPDLVGIVDYRTKLSPEDQQLHKKLLDAYAYIMQARATDIAARPNRVGGPDKAYYEGLVWLAKNAPHYLDPEQMRRVIELHRASPDHTTEDYLRR